MRVAAGLAAPLAPERPEPQCSATAPGCRAGAQRTLQFRIGLAVPMVLASVLARAVLQRRSANLSHVVLGALRVGVTPRPRTHVAPHAPLVYASRSSPRIQPYAATRLTFLRILLQICLPHPGCARPRPWASSGASCWAPARSAGAACGGRRRRRRQGGGSGLTALQCARGPRQGCFPREGVEWKQDAARTHI